MTSPGVFISTDRSEEEIIKACQQLLQRMKSDAKIVAVKRDDSHVGVKVFFSCESVVLNFLKKKNLFDHSTSTIHSLTTTFTAQNAFPTSREEFEKVLQSKMEILGPILEVSMIPISREFPDIGSGKWRVVLDVPEVEDLDVFRRNGLPDDMFLKLPDLKERLSVRFHCRFCGGDGHPQCRCNYDGDSTIVDEEDSSCGDYSQPEVMTSTSKSSFRIRDIQIESVASCSRSKSALKTSDVREFEKRLGLEEASRYTSSDSIGGDVKTEGSEIYSPKNDSTAKRRISSGTDEGSDEPTVKRARSTSTNENSFSEEDTQPGPFSKASSTTADQDNTGSILEGLSNAKKENSSRGCTPKGLFEHRKSLSEDSALVTTSNQPEQTHYLIKSEIRTSDDESDSNQHQAVATQIVRKRKLPTQGVPVVIPDRIKEITRKIPGVLNVRQLEAFCNHVKKKSTPADFATMYTNDVDGLKRQLDEISREFYNIPRIGTKAEIQFMKWFRGMRERFYGTPVRRRNPKT